MFMLLLICYLIFCYRPIMPLSSYYLSLLVSLGVLALTSSAPLDVQDDVTDYFKVSRSIYFGNVMKQ